MVKMNLLLSSVVLCTVLFLQLGATSPEDRRGRFRRQAFKNCFKCANATDCLIARSSTKCDKSIDEDLSLTGEEKSFWTDVLKQQGAAENARDVGKYSHCFTVQWKRAGVATEMRGCGSESLGAVDFCEAVANSAKATNREIMDCDNCLAKDIPCNNQIPIKSDNASAADAAATTAGAAEGPVTIPNLESTTGASTMVRCHGLIWIFLTFGLVKSLY